MDKAVRHYNQGQKPFPSWSVRQVFKLLPFWPGVDLDSLRLKSAHELILPGDDGSGDLFGRCLLVIIPYLDQLIGNPLQLSNLLTYGLPIRSVISAERTSI